MLVRPRWSQVLECCINARQLCRGRGDGRDILTLIRSCYGANAPINPAPGAAARPGAAWAPRASRSAHTAATGPAPGASAGWHARPHWRPAASRRP
ncbi:hypothetical protein G6F57_023177 [Rhizopus arrhizus]|nr:hypothetical protein G6F57_023177 [Rhizopus arrhizus]